MTCALNTVVVSTNPGAAKILHIPIIKEPSLIIKESRRRARRDRLQVIYLLLTMFPTTLPSPNSSCTCLARPVNLLGLMEEEILRIYNEECSILKAVNSDILTLSENKALRKTENHATYDRTRKVAPMFRTWKVQGLNLQAGYPNLPLWLPLVCPENGDNVRPTLDQTTTVSFTILFNSLRAYRLITRHYMVPDTDSAGNQNTQ
jgi:hypothetical protein